MHLEFEESAEVIGVRVNVLEGAKFSKVRKFQICVTGTKDGADRRKLLKVSMF